MADGSKQHTQKIKGVELVIHLREDVGRVEDPRTEALLETSAEVIEGLMAFSNFEKHDEEAWREG